MTRSAKQRADKPTRRLWLWVICALNAAALAGNIWMRADLARIRGADATEWIRRAVVEHRRGYVEGYADAVAGRPAIYTEESK